MDQDLRVVGPQHRENRIVEPTVLGHQRVSTVARSVGTGAAGACGSVARNASGGAGMRGMVRRLTGTPFMRALGSSSRCASSAPETRLRSDTGGRSGG